MTTIADGHSVIEAPADPYGYERRIKDGFLMVGGELREVKEIHRTNQGIQIELYPKYLGWTFRR